MKRLPFLLFLLCPFAASAQVLPPAYCCGPTYTYCGALVHEPVNVAVTYGFYRGRGLENSPCNNGGNFFFGNLIKIGGWGQSEVYWYDWSSDPDIGIKLATWSQNLWLDPLTVTYDVDSRRVLSISSPMFPSR